MWLIKKRKSAIIKHDKHYQGDSTAPPQRFICPLTLDVMADPVKDPITKINFERHAICEWLDRSDSVCPITRGELDAERLIPNASLRKEIKKWMKKNPDYIEESTELCTEHFTEHSSNSLYEAAGHGTQLDDRLARIRGDVLNNRQQRIDEVGRPIDDRLISVRDEVLSQRSARFSSFEQ